MQVTVTKATGNTAATSHALSAVFVRRIPLTRCARFKLEMLSATVYYLDLLNLLRRPLFTSPLTAPSRWKILLHLDFALRGGGVSGKSLLPISISSPMRPAHPAAHQNQVLREDVPSSPGLPCTRSWASLPVIACIRPPVSARSVAFLSRCAAQARQRSAVAQACIARCL